MQRQIEAFIATATDEEVLDSIAEILGKAQRLLDIKNEGDPLRCSGMACKEVDLAAQTLLVYRARKHGDKSATVL